MNSPRNCIWRNYGKAKPSRTEAMTESPGISLAEVSKTERRAELYVGTLREFIEAMDGELVLAARFKDGVEAPIKLKEGDRAG